MFLFYIYSIISVIVFILFLFPVFLDWKDFSRKEMYKCILFSICIGIIWPIVTMLLVMILCCGKYYKWKDSKNI
jgi:glycopeptide antibiotics resistance protein